MIRYILSKVYPSYKTEYVVERFQTWWENGGCERYSSKQCALVQWAIDPEWSMPAWDDDACEYLRNWAES